MGQGDLLHGHVSLLQYAESLPRRDGSVQRLGSQHPFAKGFTNYALYSLWDTFRAEHPLLALIQARATPT